MWWCLVATLGATWAATPPRFASQYSGRVHEVAQGPSAHKEQVCDINYDANANLTSYRNCGWKGTQMQARGVGRMALLLPCFFDYYELCFACSQQFDRASLTDWQMVVRYKNDQYGPRASVYYIYGHGPFGDKCAYYCDVGVSAHALEEWFCTAPAAVTRGGVLNAGRGTVQQPGVALPVRLHGTRKVRQYLAVQRFVCRRLRVGG